MGLKARLRHRISSLERGLSNAHPAYRLIHGLWSLLPGEERTANQLLRQAFEELLAAPRQGPLVLLQLGAYDGRTGDPLYPYLRRAGPWRGVLVEPLPGAFRLLQQTYGHLDGLTLEPCAVADADGEVELFSPPAFQADRWQCQTTTLRAEVYRGLHGDGEGTEPALRVPGFTLATLLARHRLESLDLLCMDLEGYDGEVLRQLLATPVRPRVLSYESCFLDQGEQRELAACLVAEGYRVVECPPDTLAVLPPTG